MKKTFIANRIKQFTAGAVVATLAFTATACDTGNEGADSTTTSAGTGTTAAGTETADGNSEDPIVIGGLAPLTGPVAVYGTAANNGALLAVDELNANGGINGRQIDYIVYDEQGDSEQAISAFERLVNEDDIVALIGDITTKPSIAVAQRAAQIGLPMLTPTGTGADITLGKDNVFRVCFIDPDQGTVMAEYVVEDLGLTKAAVIYNASDDYSVGLAEAFMEHGAEVGLEIVGEETYLADAKDFRTQLTRIAQSSPEVLYVPDYYGTNILILNQAREVGLDIPVLGGDGWDGILSVTPEDNPEEADGVIFTNHFTTTETSDLVEHFVEAYEDKYGETPISFAALGYDAVMMMAQAISEAGSTESADIVTALDAIEYDGVTGAITFDENGDPIKPIKFIAVEGGEYVLDSEKEITR